MTMVTRKACSLRPLFSRIVVERLKSEETTPAGIVLPDSAKERPHRGVVLAVGPGKFVDGKRIVPDVAVGDIVVFGHYAGNEVTDDGETYLVIDELDILAIVGPA